MSRENVEVVRRSLDAVNRRDVEEVLSLTDPDGELHSAIIGGAEGSVFRGHDGFRRWLTEMYQTFDEVNTELTEYRDMGERVLAFGRIRARGRESGLQLDSETGWIFTVRAGRLVRAEGFLSRAQALEAAGLSE
jgi:ketosteroid isomerase-like protein